MTKKAIIISFLLWILGCCVPVNTLAAEDIPMFSFQLSVDGKQTREAQKGEIITVFLTLRREDTAEPYTMYAMQDEIRYDSTFFELVEGSTSVYSNVSAADISLLDEFREFYLNYLSMSGGTLWDSEVVVGSFQLKVIADSGVTKIMNQDYLVSLEDGSGSYPCTASDLTIILTTDCIVRFFSNGGTKLEELTVQYGEKIIPPSEPSREGFQFEGWYKDIDLTEPWDFDTDTVEGNMSLYAKWSIKAEEEHFQVPCWSWIILLLILIGWLIYRGRRKYLSKRN